MQSAYSAYYAHKVHKMNIVKILIFACNWGGKVLYLKRPKGRDENERSWIP